MLNFEFSLWKFQNLNFHFNIFMKQFIQIQTSSLLQPILVYTYIYNIWYHLLRKEHLKRLCNWVISIADMDTSI